MKYKNETTGEVVEIKNPILWSLLFGSCYLYLKGLRTQAFMHVIACFLTGGIAWLLTPLFINQVFDAHYQVLGWEKI